MALLFVGGHHAHRSPRHPRLDPVRRHGQLKVQRNASLITESYTYDPSLAHLLEPWHGTSRLMRLGVLGRKVVLVIPTRMMFTL